MTTVFTIGHSNQPAADFIALLEKSQIELVVDVRSNPYSRFRHFNREPLANRLEGSGIAYLHLGNELGGHPDGDEFYVNGRVAYERLAARRGFRRGIRQIAEKSEQYRVAIMCTEEDPVKCHRHPLLTPALLERGVQVYHMRRDGSVQEDAATRAPNELQMPLIEPVGEDRTWHSPKRIRPAERS